MSLPDYYSRFNPDLLAVIPPDVKVVLEVGCGAGALYEAYKRVNPAVDWWGVESNWEALKQAEEKGIEGCLCDAESNEAFGFLKDIGNVDIQDIGNADVLIFGDVLEHLVDPWKALARYCQHLKPGGQVLASIPNVGHWSVILGLLRGEWRYQDEGLLDRTHLRFFTLEGAVEMFRGAGLEVFSVGNRTIGNEGMDQLTNLFDSRTLDRRVDWVSLTSYQYIIRSRKPIGNPNDSLRSDKPTGNLVKPLHVHAVTDGTICERPRIHEPFAALNTIPGVRCTSHRWGSIPAVDMNTESQIIIQQRVKELDLAEQRLVILGGYLLIAELDDDPAAVYGDNLLPLQAVHAVQVSAEAIAELVRPINPNVMVFDNQIADLPPWRDREEDGTVDIFFGALNRETDWAPIMPALNRVIATCGVPLAFHVVSDRAFFDALEISVARKAFTPFCDYRDYRDILSLCDIALLPLEPTQFNRCKSDLKFLECAAEGVAVLASVAAWEAIDTNKPSGIEWHGSVACTYWGEASFESTLKWMLSGDTRQIATNAYTYVRNHRLLGQHYRKRYDWYQHLLTHKPELDRQLRERVPQMGQLSASRTGPPVSLA